MNKIDIFVIVEDSLYSVLYETEVQHEFSRLFELWRDPEYLENFFSTHIQDLQSGFWGNISIEEAVLRTMSEANNLEEELITIAEMGKEDRYSTLSSLFRPLFDNTTTIEEALERNKVKGYSKRSWLRMYAIRIDSNLFVITGGGIKLTPTMNERTHLKLELKKLNIVKNYLSEEDNYDNHSIFELFI